MPLTYIHLKMLLTMVNFVIYVLPQLKKENNDGVGKKEKNCISNLVIVIFRSYSKIFLLGDL